MAILSKDVQLKKPEKICSEYVENRLKELGIDPLRWAITAQDGEFLTVSASYCD